MNKKVLWVVVAVVIIVALAWYAGYIPGWKSADQGAAAANTANIGSNPDSKPVVQISQKASFDLAGAGSDKQKLAIAASEAQAAIIGLTELLPKLQLAVGISAGKNNDMTAVQAKLQDYAVRLSSLNALQFDAKGAASAAAHLTAIVGDISAVNTALGAAKYK